MPTKIILDTDMLTDCDDVAALAMTHAFMANGEAELLGVVLNAIDIDRKHGAVVSAVNNYYGHPGIPIGVPREDATAVPSDKSCYSEIIWDEHLHDNLLDDERPSALSVYRSILAEAPDRSVTIVSIGFLNNIEELLKSREDEYDKRSGLELVRAKVKELSVMGGEYPFGKEYNFSHSTTAVFTKYVMENWPADIAPITFSGFEIGVDIITGKSYASRPSSPMKTAYAACFDSLKNGRPSWDQTAVLYAVRGVADYWEVENNGCNYIHEDGANEWRMSDTAKGYRYLKKKLPTSKLASIIENLMI